jgi:hypothetical protein
MGKIAGYYIPMLLTIFKCVSYIGFIFVIPVMIITGNMDRFKKYLILIVSFQIWPVISSILNMFVDLYSATSFSDLSRAGGISLSTLSTIENTSDMIVAIASSLQMSVPVISYAFISGGIDAVMGFHGNLTSAMNQGGSIASSEMLSGNKNFDNENIGNANNFKAKESVASKVKSNSMNGTFDITDEVIVGTASDLGIHQRDAISKLKSRDSGIRKKANEVANNIANSELEKLGSTPNLNNSSYTEKTNAYKGMRERAPLFENKYNKSLEGSVRDKVESDIETGKSDVNKKRSNLEAKENEKRGEFNVGEKEINKDSIDRNIKDRAKETNLTQEAVKLIDARTSAVKKYVGGKIPESTKDSYREFKKDVGVTDREIPDFDNESAKQIDKKKDKKLEKIKSWLSSGDNSGRIGSSESRKSMNFVGSSSDRWLYRRR